MSQVKSVINSEGDPHFILEIVYTLCKIRGFKTIVKFFPHEAADLEPTFEYLCGLRENSLWQSHYVLLVWLSIIVLVPFDLDSIDSTGDLILKVLEQSKQFLEHTGRPREAAALLISKLLTRPDMQRLQLLDSYIEWVILVQKSQQEFMKLGVLLSVVNIFSYGTRSELVKYIPQFSELLAQESNENMFLRQLKVKLAGRLALTQLKPTVSSWRYQRGARSLAANLTSTDSATPIISNSLERAPIPRAAPASQEEDTMDEDIDIPSLEREIDSLLQGLRDRDTVVRWSAAKAIGRVTGRLEKDMGDEIVAQILELFKFIETDSAWHGGCLALAELARRGLLLPSRLEQVFPLIYQALLYDKKQGNHSIGAHVRDAACYVAWSFARAYAPEDMGKHLNELARHLIIVSLFDREINCRRASSAAFQEHVGRQGSFPHGIEILTEVDYFTLGNRNHAYLQVSCFVAQYAEYLGAMVTHLLEVKLKHWDVVVRQLAACALSVLVPFAPAKFADEVLPQLIPLTVDNSLVTRNGSILGVGEILLGLAGKSAFNNDPKTIEKMLYKHAVNYYLLKSNDELSEEDQAILKDSDNRTAFKVMYSELQKQSHVMGLQEQLLDLVREIVPNIEKRRLYRGKGGQIIRQAVSRLLDCLARAGLVVSSTLVLKYQETLNECVVHTAPEIMDAAAAALIEISKTYHNSPGAALLDKTRNCYLRSLSLFNSGKEVPANIARGLSLALGCLNPALIRVGPQEVVATLIQTTQLKHTETDDAETRTNAAKALGQLVVGMLGAKSTANPGNMQFTEEQPPSEFTCELVETIYEALFECMNDYSVDRRGDVGSWVRAAAMEALERLVCAHSTVAEYIWDRLFGLLVQQLLEKMDRMRQIAGDTLTRLLERKGLPQWTEQLKPVLVDNRSYIEEFLRAQEKLQGADSLPDQSGMPVQSATGHYERGNLWSVPSFVFPIATPLIHHPLLKDYVITGIVVSVGGITESTVRSSSAALVAAVREDPAVAWSILNLYKAAPERLQIPYLKTWGLLLRDVASIAALEHIGCALFECTQKAIKGSKDIHKWLACIGVFSGLLEHIECHKEALKFLLGSLGQAFPKVRQAAASSLYTYFIGLQDYSVLCHSEQQFNRVLEIVTNTSWMLSVKEIRPVRNEIFQILGIEAPKPVVKQQQGEAQGSEDASYGALVKEMGF